ncbi:MULTISPECIES: hypothetical protein [unclassified Corallococcus]|uniref:hypothetical protein n=1 Tax=unclassified Corallococcus TaxID=2685029 RepID=UPI001CBA78AC|nr:MULTISPECIES: hypothetical protein [unclassified Corallococcus]MBZ4335488.1 hypothetical protein [Corallococcus sp. AS-1-12]MBZ4372894.1 hypothetical protein [Corallococcus sp. AS-1-6]
MTARFRLVQYMPDPFAGTKVTVGALVESGGRVELVRAPALPGPACIGSRSAWVTMQLVLDALSGCSELDVRSGEVSSLAGLSEPRRIPDGVDNPVAWVESFVLPQKGLREQDTKDAAYRQRRESMGYRFFEQWHVSQFVRRKFHAENLPVQSPKQGLPQVKHPIAHYVPGASELLLMEPIVGTRAKLTDDLKGLSESFLAFRSLFEMANTLRKPTFIVYVLTGGYEGALAEAQDVLKGAAHEIINVDDPSQRMPFLQRIMAVGRTGGDQGALALH